MLKRATSFAVLLLGFCYWLPAQQAEKRGPSTPEERQRFVAITHKLEEAPLDESLHAEREWAFRWLTEVPDISAQICTGPLGGFLKKKYKYSSEIVLQLTLSSGVFVIEHPDQAQDASAQCLAGVEGALKAYQAILKVKPDARDKALDEVLDKQRNGKLADHVRDTTSQSSTK